MPPVRPALLLGLGSPASIALGFAAGSVPFSNLVAKRRAGVDLRNVGSGTVSGSGLYEVAGAGPLVIVGLFELAKGAIAPLLAGRRHPFTAALAGAAAVAGHNWSPFLGGAGGRGDLSCHRGPARDRAGGLGRAPGRAGTGQAGGRDGAGFVHCRPSPRARRGACSRAQRGHGRPGCAGADRGQAADGKRSAGSASSPTCTFTDLSSTATLGRSRAPSALKHGRRAEGALSPGGHKLSVGVVTDSAASLPADLAGASGVAIVPMWVAIGGQQYRDGELTLKEVLDRAGEGLSTSGPAPGELAEAARAADQGDGVVILTLSHEMSGVYQSARLAMDLLEGEKVAVVDTGTAAGAEGLVVLAAAKAARAGLPLGSVVDEARRAAGRVRLLATLPSLDYLARAGGYPGRRPGGLAGLA